jgi:hypothetical protein
VNGSKSLPLCLALGYPSFGLSIAPAGYRCTIAEHARVVEGVVAQLGLREITLTVQDWGGGPIGFWVATRHPEWFRAFVIGNTWAWPMRGERSTELFSKALGSSVLGGLLVRRADVFVNVFMRGGIRRRKPTRAERQMYKRPPSHPPLAGAGAGHAAGDPGRAPTAGRGRAGTGAARRQAGPSSSGVTRTRASGSPTVGDGSAPSPTTGPTSSAGPRTTSRKTRPRRSSPRSKPGGQARPRADSQPMPAAPPRLQPAHRRRVTCPLPPAAHHPGRLHGSGPGWTRRPGAQLIAELLHRQDH